MLNLVVYCAVGLAMYFYIIIDLDRKLNPEEYPKRRA